MKQNNLSATFDQQWDALTYAKYATPQFKIAVEALGKWKFAGNEQVLDIGCGNGSITSIIAEKYVRDGSVLGIDLSRDMINFAQQTFKAKNLNFQAHDAGNLTFSNQFDFVSSFYCLHWVPEQQKAINGIFNSLKQNGKALLYVMTNPAKHENFFSHIYQTVINLPMWKNSLKDTKTEPWHFQTKDNYKKILDASGLKTINLELDEKIINFKNKQELLTWLSAIPFVNHLAKDLHDKLIEDIADICLKYCKINPDHSVNFSFPTMIINVQKD